MNPERKNKLVFSTQGMYTGQSQTKSILVSLWRTNFKMLSGKWTVLEKTGTAMEACCVKNGLCVITQIINERSQLLLLFFLGFFYLNCHSHLWSLTTALFGLHIHYHATSTLVFLDLYLTSAETEAAKWNSLSHSVHTCVVATVAG